MSKLCFYDLYDVPDCYISLSQKRFLNEKEIMIFQTNSNKQVGEVRGKTIISMFD